MVVLKLKFSYRGDSIVNIPGDVSILSWAHNFYGTKSKIYHNNIEIITFDITPESLHLKHHDVLEIRV